MSSRAGATVDGTVPRRRAPWPVAPRLDQTRAVIAVGDPHRERLVLQVFADAAEDGSPLRIVRRCLDADDLLGSIRRSEADLAVVSADLHGLGTEALRGLIESRVSLLLWATTSAIPDDLSDRATVVILPGEAEIPELRAALGSLVRAGGRLRRPAPPPVARRPQPEADAPQQAGLAAASVPATGVAGAILALVGAPGGQGVSTICMGLAAALSRTASAALVDLDLHSPSLALALDLNPARNLYMVLHEAGTRADPGLWSRLLEAELQPLDPDAPRGVVLAGAPGNSLAAAVRPDSAQQLLRQLAGHYRYVVVDVGSTVDPAGATAAQRAVLETADRVFLVARADLVGLRRAATLLESLRGIVDRADARLALVLNRHQARHHHDAVDVARALRATVAAVIPDDPNRAHAALAAPRPLVAFGGTPRGSAARALAELARSIDTATPAGDAATGSSRAWSARWRKFGLFSPRRRRP